MKQAKNKAAKPKKPVKQKATGSPAKFTTVNEYITSLPAKTKVVTKKLREIIRAGVPGAEEVISYGIAAFKWEGMLIWIAGWKEHVSVYPKSRAMEEAIKEISSYEGAKGTIKFPLDKPLPAALIKKIVQFRMKENLARKNAKKLAAK